MDEATALLYLKCHKCEDSEVTLLIFHDEKMLNYWKRMNNIPSNVNRVENYEWAILTKWKTIIGRRYKDYKVM